MSLLAWIRHFFIPHHSNNHKAKILHPITLSIFVAIFLVGQFFLNFYLLLQPSVLGFASNITPERIIEITNQKRGEQGLPPLNIDTKLNDAAQRKAGDMFAFNYWAHTSPSGRTPWTFFNEAGYKYLYAGENLARDFMNPEAVVDAWMNSPSHRDNLMNPNYKEIGIAVVNGTLNGVETTLVVQLFGTPTPAPSLKKEAQKTNPLPVPQLGEASAAENKILTTLSLSQASGHSATLPLFSPFWLTKTVVVFLLGLVLGALLLDIIFVNRRKIVRLSGRNIAHLLFLGTLLLAIILTSQGAIL